MKSYFVRPAGRGYGEVVDPGILMTLPQARKALTSIARKDAKDARRYFGTAVCHKLTKDHVMITARRDPNSALWCHWIVSKWV